MRTLGKWFAGISLTVVVGTPLVAGANEPLPLVADKGFVTPVHEKMAGKIVFAKTAAAVTTPEKPEQFISAFQLADPIYFRAYLHRSFGNDFRAAGIECRSGVNEAFRYWLAFVDGKSVSDDTGFFHQPLEQEGLNRSTSLRFDDALNGAAHEGESSPQSGFNQKIRPLLTTGTHKIKIQLVGSCNDSHSNYHKLPQAAAEGEFTVTVSAAQSAAASSMPTSAMNAPAVVTGMKHVMERKWPTDRILKVVIVDKQWAVEMWKGHPVHRTIRTAVAVKQGDKCRLFGVTFIQKAAQHGFGATDYNSVGNSDEIPCAGVK